MEQLIFVCPDCEIAPVAALGDACQDCTPVFEAPDLSFIARPNATHAAWKLAAA